MKRHLSTREKQVLRVERIAQKHMSRAAKAAEKEIRPLLLKALKRARRFVDIESIEEVMGHTIILVRGRPDLNVEDLNPNHDTDNPLYCTPAAKMALDDLIAMCAVAGEYRATYVLYDVLK